MDSHFKPPDYLSMQGNAGENWRRWLQRFELCMIAREADSKPEKTKIAILLSAIGPEALARYNHFKWGEDEPQVSVPVQVQAEGQAGHKVQPGTRALEKELYADVVDVDVDADKIVFSMKDKHLQERLLREVKLTLGRAVDICKSAEVTRREVQTIKKSPIEAPKTVHVVNSKWRNKESYRTKEHKPEKADKKAKKPWKCFCCGQQHDYMECPAYIQKCGKCGVFNHFAEFWRREKSVREIVQMNDESDDEFLIDSLCIGNIERGED